MQSAQEWKCKVHIQFCKMEDSIENAATTTNQPLSHQLSLENRRVSDRLRRQGESDEQRQQRLGARRASRRLESHDQHEQRLQNRRVSDRLRRDQESHGQEEHDQRLQRRRERDALARQEESQEQHEQRLERRRVSDRLRRHQERAMNRDYRTGVRVSEQGVNNKLLNTGNIILHCEDFATKQWNNS